jgi:hypothetical protein
LVELIDSGFTGRGYVDVYLEIPGVLKPIKLERIYYG